MERSVIEGQVTALIEGFAGRADRNIVELTSFICQQKNLLPEDLFGGGTEQHLVEARFTCFYLIKHLLRYSCNYSCKSWGYYASSVWKGVKRFEEWLEMDSSLRLRVEQYKKDFLIYKEVG